MRFLTPGWIATGGTMHKPCYLNHLDPPGDRTMNRTLLILPLAALALAGCTSDADKVSKNLSTAAEQFEVQRKIVGVNGITDKPAFEVEGKCSIETPGAILEVVCKHGPDDFRKHFVGLSDNVFFVAVQVEGIAADEYRTRIVIKPENIVPNFDVE